LIYTFSSGLSGISFELPSFEFIELIEFIEALEDRLFDITVFEVEVDVEV